MSALEPITEQLELRDGFEVLGTTGRAFQAQESVQRDVAAPDTEGLDLDRLRQKLSVVTATQDFTEQIEVADVRRQGEVEPVHDRSEEHTSELQSLRHLVCRL